MTSTSTDRRFGVQVSQAIKVPVAAATTADITLSGAQTIDGVSVVAEDRVLVKDQSTGSENGIYIAATGDWVRAPDWDGTYDVVTGTRVLVTGGTNNGNTEWYVSTTGAITIGTTSVTFTQWSGLLQQTQGVTTIGAGTTLTDDALLAGGGSKSIKVAGEGAGNWTVSTVGSTMTAGGDLNFGGFNVFNVGETVQALSISTAGTVTPDFSAGPLMTLARTTAALTVAAPTNLPTGASWIMRMTSTGGGGSVAFAAAYRDAAGSTFVASTSVDAVDILTFLTLSTGGTIDYFLSAQSS